MTRRNPYDLADFEPEIEAKARRIHGQTLRKKKRLREQANSQAMTSNTIEESIDSTQVSSTPIEEDVQAPMAEDQTIRQLAAAPAVE